MVESPDFTDPRARHPGVQPLWRRCAARRAAMMDTLRRAAGRPAGPRLPHLHVHHDAALRARGSGASMASPCGCSTGPTRRAGRSKGLTLRAGWESFVGAGPMPMRHGLTLGELGAVVRRARSSSTSITSVIAMEGWQPGRRRRASAGRSASAPGSTRARTPPNLWMARAYAGHGDARGHDAVRRAAARRGRWNCSARPTSTRKACIAEMRSARARTGCEGCRAARLLVRADLPQARRAALQRRADPRRGSAPTTTTPSSPGACRRWRSRRSGASIPTIRSGATFPYEYELDRLAIDLINGGPLLREWVDDAGRDGRRPRGAVAGRDEAAWRATVIATLLLYP